MPTVHLISSPAWEYHERRSASLNRNQLEVKAYGWLVALLGKVFDLAQIHSRSMQTILHNLSDALERKQHSNG